MLIHSDKYFIMEFDSVQSAVNCPLHTQNRCSRGIWSHTVDADLAHARSQCHKRFGWERGPWLPWQTQICQDPSQPYLVLDPVPVKRGKLIVLHVLSPDGHPVWVRFAWHLGWKDVITGQRVGVKPR